MSDKISKYHVTEQDNGALRIEGKSINTREIFEPQCNPMIINGAWYINQLPNQLVLELVDGSLGMFYLTPFRAIKEADIKLYKGYHPRKCKGSPLPEYLYRFYGLARNEETLSEVIRIRVSPSEKEKLEAVAANGDKTISEFIRDYIRGL